MTNEITLNEDQTKAMEAINAFLLNDVDTYFVLNGSPGTGKSVCIEYFCDTQTGGMQKYLDLCKLLNITSRTNLLKTATTNQAVANISGVAKHTQAQTIHKLLGLKVVNTNGSTRLTDKNSNKPVILKDSIIFIDEYSMIDYGLFQHITSKLDNCKVIFVGDKNQLTAVRCADNPVANMRHTPSYTLTRQVRTKSDIISKNTSNMANAIEAKLAVPYIITDQTDVYAIQSKDELDEIIKNEFSDIHSNNKIIAYTNDACIKYNSQVLRNIYPNYNYLDTEDAYLLNVNYYTNSAFNGYPYNLEDSKNFALNLSEYGTTIIAPNSNIVLVRELQKLSFTDFIQRHLSSVLLLNTPSKYDALKNSFKDLKFTVYQGELSVTNSFKCVSKNVIIMTPSSRTLYKDLVKESYKSDQLASISSLNKNFVADIRLGAAVTTHKAQGTTYNKVLLDLNDINQCRNLEDKRRLIYVAMSRAKEKIYLWGHKELLT